MNDTTTINTQDITGLRFGKLIAIERAGFHVEPSNAKRILWLCFCDCGVKKKIMARSLLRKEGGSMSCGCINTGNRQHGMYATLVYNSWQAMKSRCNDKRHHAYKNYGERGIKVCERWNKFENFYKDMGDRPENKSLDRINNEGDYYKENCKWSTLEEQGSNKRTNIKHNGETAAQASRRLGGDRHMVLNRLELGWSKDKAFNTEKTC